MADAPTPAHARWLAEPEHAVLVLLDGTGEAALRRLDELIAGGCRFVQYREKSAPRREVLVTAQVLVTRAHQAGARLVVNDHIGIAHLCGADGVHLGQDDIPPTEARRILDPTRVIGASTHDRDELADALEAGVDYVGIGTIFASPSKPELGARGVELLADLTARCPVPSFAIGGIDAARAAACIAAGATGVAVASAVTGADDVRAATRRIVDAVGEARAARGS